MLCLSTLDKFKHKCQFKAPEVTRTSYLLSRGGTSEGGGKLSLNTVKGWCVGKPVNQLNSYKRLLLPAHHCSLCPLCWGSKQRKFLWRRTLPPKPDPAAAAEHKQQLSTNYRENVQSSICCISSEKWINIISVYLIRWEIHFPIHNLCSCFKFYDVFQCFSKQPWILCVPFQTEAAKLLWHRPQHWQQ